MKHNKSIILLISFISVLTSCKKSFLEIEDNSIPNRQSYIKDLASLDQYMKGVYVMASCLYESYYSAIYPEIIADNLKPSTEGLPLGVQYNWSQQVDKNTLPTIEVSMNQVWQEYYKVIRACNFVIEDVDKYKNENADKANDLKGQAYAIRALIHFKLVNIFAQAYKFTAEASHPGIPYITASEVKTAFTRQTTAEVYNNLISDLNNAISLLPPTVADTRYMNSAAAKALLARVYLFKEDYANAKTLATELINKSPLMTIGEGYPSDLFINKPADQTEILFQLAPVNDGAQSFSYFIGYLLAVSYYYGTEDVANLLTENPNDIRNTWVAGSTGGPWEVKKFPVGVAGGLGFSPETDYYSPIVRSSEMYLTAAEAAAKTNDDVNARNYLNAIRKRADPSIADVTATGPALIDSIYKERRKELCFEGLRMPDLQRWKKTVQRTDVLPGYQTTLPYPSEKAIAPLPDQDVKLMGLQQNPGY